MKNIQAFIIGLFTILIVGAATANAATWTVTKSTNSNDNVCDADCSLREAVFSADSGDTVAFSPNLVGQTFTLGGSEIVITKRITIDGFLNDPNVAFISGEMTNRIFHIQSSGSLDLRNAILVQGNGNDDNFGEGGAIYADVNASLSLDRVALRGNSTHFYGAIFLNSGNHRIVNSSLTGNNAASCSAIGILSGNLYMANVTVSGNFRSGNGGIGSTICNSSGDVFIRNSTIVYNTSNGAGAIFNGSGGDINLGNTIVAQNTGQIGPDIRFANGTLTSVGGNLIGDLSTVPANTFNQPMDISGVNPLLAPTNSLQGGHPIATHPLQAGSPARNGGINANAVDPLSNSPLTTDARGAGFPRIAAGTVDKGAFEDQSGDTSLIVSKKADTNDLVCDTDCSLREAVYQASLNFGTDTITFAANVFGTITLGGTEILIQNQNVNIVGYTKASILTVSGNDASRIFRLNNATLNISGMTLTDGSAGLPNQLGGAILGANSNLTLDRMILTGNNADAYPAFYMNGGSTQRVMNSTISGNFARTCVGIGIKTTALFMANTTVSNNFASTAGGHGAICSSNDSFITVRNSTIAFNRIGGAGSSGAGFFLSDTTLNIGNSIVAKNSASVFSDIALGFGSIISTGGNLIGDSAGFPAGTFSQNNDAVGVDPLLDSLGDNGGNVTTHLLMPNSPALNSGINANALDPIDSSVLATDARGGGYERISGGTVDKGAFESLAPTAGGATISGRVMNGKRGIARARVYLTGQNGETRTTTTNPFGYFTFSDVTAGEGYIVNVSSKSYTFLPQVITVNQDLSDLNFSPQ